MEGGLFSLITLPAGGVCGMVCDLNTEREAQRRTQAMGEQGDVAHFKFCEQRNRAQLQNPV